MNSVIDLFFLSFIITMMLQHVQPCVTLSTAKCHSPVFSEAVCTLDHLISDQHITASKNILARIHAKVQTESHVHPAATSTTNCCYFVTLYYLPITSEERIIFLFLLSPVVLYQTCERAFLITVASLTGTTHCLASE